MTANCAKSDTNTSKLDVGVVQKDVKMRRSVAYQFSSRPNLAEKVCIVTARESKCGVTGKVLFTSVVCSCPHALLPL